MNAWVVDSNVPIVANGRSSQASADCVLQCIDALEKARKGLICMDDGFAILSEYMKNLSSSGQPGPGDAFMKWVFQNQAVPECCERVRISRTDDDFENYQEFPDDPDLSTFDPSDRKFVAVALASEQSPTILNAVDSDWWNARGALMRHRVTIDFLCGNVFEN